MNPRLAESWINRADHVVYGRRLHPYCLYDVLFLLIDENPLVLKHRDVTESDLRTAVMICSTSPERLLAGANYQRGPAWFTRWRTLVWRHRTRGQFKVEVRKFLDFISDYDVRPRFWTDEDEGGSAEKVPWVMSLLTFLETYTNMTERQIMTASIGLMFWKSASIAAQQGMSRDEIMSEEEENAIVELGLE